MPEHFGDGPLAPIDLVVEGPADIIVAGVSLAFLDHAHQIGFDLPHRVAAHFPVVRVEHFLFPHQKLGHAILRTAGRPIDTDGRLLDARDAAIPGLYAAGNSAAWLDIGGGCNSGIANTRGLLYGYLAALHMTGQHAAPETPASKA